MRGARHPFSLCQGMRVLMAFDGFMGMGMGLVSGRVNVKMAMLMGVQMGMGMPIVAMFVAMDMGMEVRVLQGNGILCHEKGTHRHKSQGYIKLKGGALPEERHAEAYPKKGSQRIIGAGFGGA